MKNIYQMTREELTAAIAAEEKAIIAEYKTYAKLSKESLLAAAKKAVMVNSFSMKSSKDELIRGAMSSKYFGLTRMEKALRTAK